MTEQTNPGEQAGRLEILDSEKLKNHGALYGRFLLASLPQAQVDDIINPENRKVDFELTEASLQSRNYNPVCEKSSIAERKREWEGKEFSDAYSQWRTKFTGFMTKIKADSTREEALGIIMSDSNTKAAGFTEVNADRLFEKFCKDTSNIDVFVKSVTQNLVTDEKIDPAKLRRLLPDLQWIASGLFGKNTATQVVTRLIELESELHNDPQAVLDNLNSNKERINKPQPDERDVLTVLHQALPLQQKMEPEEKYEPPARDLHEDQEEARGPEEPLVEATQQIEPPVIEPVIRVDIPPKPAVVIPEPDRDQLLSRLRSVLPGPAASAIPEQEEEDLLPPPAPPIRPKDDEIPLPYPPPVEEAPESDKGIPPSPPIFPEPPPVRPGEEEDKKDEQLVSPPAAPISDSVLPAFEAPAEGPTPKTPSTEGRQEGNDTELADRKTTANKHVIQVDMGHISPVDLPKALNEFLSQDRSEPYRNIILLPAQVKEYILTSLPESYRAQAGEIQVDRDNNRITIKDIKFNIPKIGGTATFDLSIGNNSKGIVANIQNYRGGLRARGVRGTVESKIQAIDSVIKQELGKQIAKDNPLWSVTKIFIDGGEVLVGFEEQPAEIGVPKPATEGLESSIPAAAQAGSIERPLQELSPGERAERIKKQLLEIVGEDAGDRASETIDRIAESFNEGSAFNGSLISGSDLVTQLDAGKKAEATNLLASSFADLEFGNLDIMMFLGNAETTTLPFKEEEFSSLVKKVVGLNNSLRRGYAAYMLLAERFGKSTMGDRRILTEEMYDKNSSWIKDAAFEQFYEFATQPEDTGYSQQGHNELLKQYMDILKSAGYLDEFLTRYPDIGFRQKLTEAGIKLPSELTKAAKAEFDPDKNLFTGKTDEQMDDDFPKGMEQFGIKL